MQTHETPRREARTNGRLLPETARSTPRCCSARCVRWRDGGLFVQLPAIDRGQRQDRGTLSNEIVAANRKMAEGLSGSGSGRQAGQTRQRVRQ